MKRKIEIHAAVEATGRFRAIVHDGHKRDDLGNIIRHGNIRTQTPFGRNKITLKGFEHILQHDNPLCMVAGSSNTAPAEANTVLGAYAGKTQTHVSTVTTRSTVVDGDGNVYWRVTIRMTFEPESLGMGAINIAEAGVVSLSGVSFSSVNSATPVSARGLLVDNVGSPTTVSLNAAIEYLDLIWEYTEYVKASVTGTTNHTIFGDVIAHDWEVRPTWFENPGGAYIARGWGPAPAATLPGFVAVGYPYGDWEQGSTQARSTNGLGTISSAPANDSGLSNALRAANGYVVDDYVPASKQRTMEITWLPSRANIAGGIQSFMVNCGHTSWQVSYDPKFDKTDDDQLDLNFTLSMANKA